MFKIKNNNDEDFKTVWMNTEEKCLNINDVIHALPFLQEIKVINKIRANKLN